MTVLTLAVAQVIHPRLIVLGYSEASMLLRGEAARDVKAVLAIVGNREFAVEAPDAIAHRLLLAFDDVSLGDPNDPVLAIQAVAHRKWNEQVGRPQAPPTSEHVRAIVEFAERVRGIDGAVLCHCMAGVSRSTAAGLLCLAAWTGPGNEEYCVRELMRVRPCAIPHRDLVRFGDELLGRDGRLMRALTSTASHG